MCKAESFKESSAQTDAAEVLSLVPDKAPPPLRSVQRTKLAYIGTAHPWWNVHVTLFRTQPAWRFLEHRAFMSSGAFHGITDLWVVYCKTNLLCQAAFPFEMLKTPVNILKTLKCPEINWIFLFFNQSFSNLTRHRHHWPMSWFKKYAPKKKKKHEILPLSSWKTFEREVFCMCGELSYYKGPIGKLLIL